MRFRIFRFVLPGWTLYFGDALYQRWRMTHRTIVLVTESPGAQRRMLEFCAFVTREFFDSKFLERFPTPPKTSNTT